jgi:DnaJ-class molecular chaperone
VPKDFDPEEVPTSPEIGVFCPTCKGEGWRLAEIETADVRRVRMARRICPTCKGRKRLTRQEVYTLGRKR